MGESAAKQSTPSAGSVFEKQTPQSEQVRKGTSQEGDKDNGCREGSR